MTDRIDTTVEPNAATLLRVAAGARATAAAILLRRWSGGTPKLETWEKSPGALVTDADMESDAVIAEVLENSGLGGKIVSEETPTVLSEESPIEWLVDPLCGTVPFSTGMPHWGVNVAVRRQGVLVASSFATPVSGEALDTVAGVVPRDELGVMEVTPLRSRLGESTVGLEIDGKDVWDRLATTGGLRWLSKVGQANSFASAAYPLMQVCRGRMSGVVFYRIEPMHVAAGALAAESLGIRVSDAAGNPIDWSSDDEFPIFVVAWDAVHAELIDALAECM